ncbi:uncharacterized protein LOC142625428 [Castanea sativa]|uniref:uncharacterized protein LOC142625428 n=1 Tax=Castanea sativa TaxID=21020 RepID=UPI003F6496F9
MSFSDEDKIGTLQPHDDALVVTLRIGGHDVKIVLVDQGSKAEIMYPDLYKGLNLKPKNLACFDSPLVGFDGKIVISSDVVVEGAKCEELEEIAIGEDKDKFFQVGVQLPPREKEELIFFLRENVDVFTWNAYEASGMDPNFIFHHLNVNPSVTPKKQPSQRSSKEHSDAVKEEVIKLKRAGAIKEVFYPEWLANTVVVKKKYEKWRVCVAFTNLNKTCPKDPFPMPRIDQLVDATVGHP